MGFHIIQDGKKVGWTADTFAAGESITFVPDDKPYAPSLDDVRAEKIVQIKRWAREQIQSMEWRLQRSKERDALGIESEKPLQVLAEREAIRRASNRAEIEVNSLENTADIESYVVVVQEFDKPAHQPLTHVQFLRRFTDAERVKINQLRVSDVKIDDYFHLLELAKFINVEDSTVIEGVNMLETSGLIASGRAREILEGIV